MFKKRLFLLKIAIFYICVFFVMKIYTLALGIGIGLDSYKGVKVYFNGYDYTKVYGQHFSSDRYYYGKKWQCVEFVKRFYYDAKKHRMPDVMGHAKDFFAADLPQGSFNKRRGLIQYRNGGNVAPEVDDLLVFTNNKFGHVAIITKVNTNFIEIIQQNVSGKTREVMPLRKVKGKYYVANKVAPAGWLRIPTYLTKTYSRN